MKTQVEAEAKEDLVSYDKYMCWCETNDREKSAAIAAAQQSIRELTAFLEEAAAKEGQLKTEIAELERSIQEDQDSLAAATAVREKERATFQAEEADSKETRALLGQAIDTLSKVQLVQRGGKAAAAAQRKAAVAALVQVRDAVSRQHPVFHSVMQRDLFDVLSSLEDFEAETQQRQAQAPGTLLREAFLTRRPAAALEQQGQPKISEEDAGKAAKPNSLTGAAAGAKSYNSRSGAIFGILSAMLDQFSRDLGAAQKAELNAEIQFQHLRAAKTGEIAAATEQIKLKRSALADLAAQVAQAKHDLGVTGKALDADQAFLANLKENCKTEHEQYQTRVKDRNEEVRALGEALKILTDDEARDLFGKTISLLQVGAARAAENSAQRVALEDRAAERAMQRIASVGKKHNNWSLISLAVRVRLDTFTKVKEAMDTMLAELKKQQSEEYAKKEFCDEQIDQIEDLIKEGNYVKEDLDEKHRSLTNLIDTLNREIEALKAEVKEMEISLKQAGEQRKAQNQLFQSSMADQRATINILHKAQTRLHAFYASSLAEVRARTPGMAVSAEPEAPKDYQKSASAGGVLQLLAQIVNDAESTEAALQVSEQHSQKAYASFVRDTAASIENDRTLIQEKLAQVASAEGDKSEVQAAQMANDQELDRLNHLLHAHHVDCDFLLKYFDIRQKTRAEEMDSITDAHAILSGANFGK